MLPEIALAVDSADSAKSSGSSQNAASDTSDTEREDGCGSPRVQRRKRRRNKSHNGGVDRGMGVGADGEQDDLAYVDTLPEVSYAGYLTNFTLSGILLHFISFISCCLFL